MLERIRRWRWALLVAGLLAIGLLFAFWPEAEPVDIGTVTRGEMQVGVTDDAVTRAEEYYVVSAPVTGFLSRIELEAGDRVARGTLITTVSGRPSTPLDRRSLAELRSALAAARASEQGAVAALVQAEKDLVRAKELSERGFLPHAQLEQAQTRVVTLRSARAQNRAEIARLEALLAAPTGSAGTSPVVVRAPVSGSVMSVITESEGVIAEGTALMTIGDPDRIEIVADLLSREAAQIRPGDRVLITEWGGPDPLRGTVKLVEPFGRLKISALGIEEQRVNVIIAFDDSARTEAARLGHGYQVDVTVIRWESDNVLRLPIGALFRGPAGGWRVFVNEGNRARAVPVEIGHINDLHAEVLGGLEEGAAVVLNPGNSLEDGAAIAPREP